MLLLTVVLSALSGRAWGNTCSDANEAQFCSCRTDSSTVEDCGTLDGVVVDGYCIVGPYHCSPHGSSSQSSSSDSWSDSDALAGTTGACTLTEFYSAFVGGAPAASCPDGDCDNFTGFCNFSGSKSEFVTAGSKCCVNAPPPTFTVELVPGANNLEGTGAATTRTFRVKKTGRSTAADVVIETVAGSATAGADFTPLTSHLLSFSAAPTAQQDVPVTVLGDATCEFDETFTVKLRDATNGAVIAVAEATATIQNDDACVRFSIAGPVAAAEGSEGTTTTFAFTVTKALANGGAGNTAAEVTFLSVDGTAVGDTLTTPGDYAPVTGTLAFAAAETEMTIEVTVNGDSLCEFDETFSVKLDTATALAQVDATPAVATIQNDDSCATFALSAIADSVPEGNMLTFKVTKTPAAVGAGNTAGTVNFVVNDASATAASGDFTLPVPLSVAFGALDVEKTIQIQTNNDATCEIDETLTVKLTSATIPATVDTTPVLGTIQNNDACASFSIADATIAEGKSGETTKLRFQVTKTGTGAATVTYETAANTATGVDFVAIAATPLAFVGAAGEVKFIEVTINGDATCEPDEKFFVRLVGATNFATITDNEAVGTITNDDICPCTKVGDVCDDGKASTTNDKCVTATVCGGATATNVINAVGGEKIGFFVGDDGKLFEVPSGAGVPPSSTAPYHDHRARLVFKVVIPRAVACDVLAIWSLDGKPIATEREDSSSSQITLKEDASGSLRRGFHYVTVELRTAPQCVASLTPFESNVQVAFE